MRTSSLILLILTLVSTAADAHWRHHRYHHHHSYNYSARDARWHGGYVHETEPHAANLAPNGDGSRVPTAAPPDGGPTRATENAAGDWVPPGWQLQPGDPNSQVKRLLSPDGTASFSASTTPVGQEPIAEHMKSVAFVDGEQITRLRGERSWIEVSGFKGDRIFYRKAVLACGGTSWHEWLSIIQRKPRA
jgi:hypothetical protein